MPTSPKVFNEKMRDSNIEFYNNVSLQQLTLMNSIDDSEEGRSNYQNITKSR